MKKTLVLEIGLEKKKRNGRGKNYRRDILGTFAFQFGNQILFFSTLRTMPDGKPSSILEFLFEKSQLEFHAYFKKSYAPFR